MNWTKKLVIEFHQLATKGQYGIFAGMETIEAKLDAFIRHKTGKQPKPQKKRNADGSTVYIDSLGKTWRIEKATLPKKRGTMTFYVGECVEEPKLSVRERGLKLVKEAIEKKVQEWLEV